MSITQSKHAQLQLKIAGQLTELFGRYLADTQAGSRAMRHDEAG